MRRLVALAAVIPIGLVGCGDMDRGSPQPTGPPGGTPSTASISPTWPPASMASPGVEFDPALHDELMAMFRRDQAGRTGGVDNEGDEVRTHRLKQIIAEYGWPIIDLVGEDGADAAWAIAQHSDLDPEFQAAALELLTAPRGPARLRGATSPISTIESPSARATSRPTALRSAAAAAGPNSPPR
jgi:hypothetical protein